MKTSWRLRSNSAEADGPSRDFSRNSLFGVVGGLSSSIAGFASGIVVARLLGADGTGAIAMALWLVFATVTISDAGISGALARYIPEASLASARNLAADRKRVFVFALCSGLTCLSLVVAFLGRWLFGHILPSEAEEIWFFALICCCFIVHMAYAYGYQYLRGLRRFDVIAHGSLLGAVGQIATVFAGALCFGIPGAFVGYIVGSLPLGLMLLKAERTSEPLEPATRRRVSRYGLSLWFSGLLSPLLWTRVDLVLVGTLMGIGAAGMFTAAAGIAALLMQLCVTLSASVVPHLASTKPESRTETSAALMRLLLLIMMPLAFGTAAIAPRLLRLVYGPDFGPGGVPGIILALAAAATITTIALSNIMNVLEQNGKLMVGGALGALATLLLAALLIPLAGLAGAATARLLGQLSITFVTLYQVNHIQPGTLRLPWLIRLWVACSGCALVAAGCLGLWASDWALLPAMAAGGATFVILCKLIVPVHAEDLDRLDISRKGPLGRTVHAVVAALS